LPTIVAAVAALAAGAANAGDRLLVTGGAQQVEGAAGGGLVPWALIAGYGTRDQVGGSAFVTGVRLDDFDLRSSGVAVGFFDRVEVSLARQRFDAGSVIPGLVLRMDTIGAKVRVAGDAIYAQDSPMPQVSVGIMHKRDHDATIPLAVGARRGSDNEFYVAATKLWLAGLAGRNVLLNGTLRATRANQLGLLGFGGDRSDKYRIQPEVSAAVMLSDSLAVGAESRWKPDNLHAFGEDDARDVFLAWFPSRYTALTVAYADLGRIAGKPRQRGAYASLQLTY
jgi:hypothetical protein